MIAHTECTTYCLDELSKLTKLLSLLGQSVTDEKADMDDISLGLRTRLCQGKPHKRR